MIFPFVNLLVRPLSWVFGFIEYMFLVMIYCVHKIFSWTTTVVIFCVQAWIYSLVEGVFKQFLSVIDRLIFQLLPNWIPYLLFSDVASLLSLTALRSSWYSTRYLTSLKWILIFRMGIWLIVSAPRLCYKLCKEGQLRFEQRKSQWEPTESRFRLNWPSRRRSPSALDVGLPIPSALPTPPTPPNLPITSSQTSALPLPPSTSSVRSLAPPRKTDRAEAHSEGNISPEELFYKQLKPRGRSKSPSLRNGISGSYLRPTVPSLG